MTGITTYVQDAPPSRYTQDELNKVKVDLAKLEVEVRHLTNTVVQLNDEISKLRDSIAGISEVLASVRGGWKTAMLLGSIGTAVIGGAAWLISFVFSHK